MASLLDKRLIFVTGKGGVGKSTVAAALGLIAARRGRNAIIAEVAAQERVLRALGGDGAAPLETEIEVAPGLHTISIDPQRAMEEYLEDQIPVRPLADLLGGSRMFQYFAAATPGMRELLTIGKVWDLVQPRRRTRTASGYDLAIVDAPATGHALAVLRAPRTFAEIARVGPIHRQARTIEAMLADAGQTGVVGVSMPAEMAVNETLLLRDELAGGDPPLDRVIVNAVYPERFRPAEARRLSRALEHAGAPLERVALRAALSEHARARGQREQIKRLEAAIGTPAALLPFVFEPQLGRAAIERLSGLLEEQL